MYIGMYVRTDRCTFCLKRACPAAAVRVASREAERFQRCMDCVHAVASHRTATRTDAYAHRQTRNHSARTTTETETQTSERRSARAGKNTTRARVHGCTHASLARIKGKRKRGSNRKTTQTSRLGRDP